MKKILITFFAAILLISCTRPPVYRDDLPAGKVAAEIAKSMPDSAGLILYSDEDIASYLEIPAELSEDRCVMVQTNSVSIDEIGVFHAADGQSAERIEDLLEAYFDRSEEAKEDWLREILPGEISKLEDAEILRRGEYVIYLILGKADRRIAAENIEKILSE